MTVTDLVACLYSDDDYTQFICQSSLLYGQGLITEDELKARVEACKVQVSKQ